MRSRLIFFILLFATISVTPNYAVITFERTYGGSRYDYGSFVRCTPDGGYIIVGYSNSFNNSFNFYLIKTDSLGDTLWTKTYGGGYTDRGSSLDLTSDGGYIIVGSTESFGPAIVCTWVIKADSVGDVVWQKTYGDSGCNWGSSIQQASDSGYIIGSSTTAYSGGWTDFFLIKISPTGDIWWSKVYGVGGSNNDDCYCVRETDEGGYVAVGCIVKNEWDIWLIKTYYWGDTTWTKNYGGVNNDVGRSVQQTSEGGYIITGFRNKTYPFFDMNLYESALTSNSTPSKTDGPSDLWLIKTDTNGDTLWTKTYGGSEDDIGNSVQQTLDTGYIIGGSTSSFATGGDVWLIKTDTNGDTLWTRTYGGDGSDYCNSIQQTPDGGYILVGTTRPSGSSYTDVYLIKTDSQGNVAGVQEQTDKRSVTRDMRLACRPNPFTSSSTVSLHGVSEHQ